MPNITWCDLPTDVSLWPGLPLSLSGDEVMPLDYHAGRSGWLLYGRGLDKQRLTQYQTTLGAAMVIVAAWCVEDFQVIRLAGSLTQRATRLAHAQYIDFAVKYANKVAFIDTDFVTTQAFCKKYEGREHPFVQVLIDEYRFDLVILLENNTPWVADGMRSLGSSVDRKEFQTMLVGMLHENNVEFVHVEEPDYDTRFLRCVELVKEMMGEQK